MDYYNKIKDVIAKKEVNKNERNYYINQCVLNNLSKRELIKLIKEKAS